MSVQALQWSFSLELYDMAAKAVLHALADHADEYGRCWPSIARIARFAGCSDKTARRALHRVVELGIVASESRAGQSDVFTLNFGWAAPSQIDQPSQIGSGQVDQAPLPTCPPTPPKLTSTPPKLGVEPSRTLKKNPQGTPKARSDQGTRLSEDWRPTESDRAFASDLGLDPDNVAEEFRDYWLSIPGARGRRSDWSRTFKNRCRELCRRGKPHKSWQDKRAEEMAAAIERGLSK